MIQAGDVFRSRSHQQTTLAGVRVDAVAADNAAGLLRTLIPSPSCQHVVTVNANYVRQAAANPRLREIIKGASTVVPDGMPLVWAMKVKGLPVRSRMTGHDLANGLIELSQESGISLFFLGAAPGVAEAAARNVRASHPQARIAGCYSPPPSAYPFPEEENERILREVNNAGADAVLVAFGCPKQDLWIADNIDRIGASVAVGVGCVLDVLAGEVKRAPGLLQRSGLEWGYRLYQEPGRLFSRYLADAAFLPRLFFSGGPRTEQNHD